MNIKKKKAKKSIEAMVIYTNPSFPLDEENVFHSGYYYKSLNDFHRQNIGYKALILIPKESFPKSGSSNRMKR
jgi:hypothetical protein